MGVAPRGPISTPPRLYLYRDGDECEAVTGGWETHLQGTANVTKNATTISLSGSYVYGSHFGTALITTKNQVHIGNYNTAVVKLKSFSTYGTGFTMVGDDVGAGTAYAFLDTYEYPAGTKLSKNFADKTARVLKFGCYPTAESGTSSFEMEISEIYLTKSDV